MSEKLWNDYLFLTREMKKCLVREDLDLFMELLNQRQKMQTLIEQTADGFSATTAGQSLIKAVQQENNLVQQRLTIMNNQSQQQQAVSKAYDAYSSGAVGGWMDRRS